MKKIAYFDASIETPEEIIIAARANPKDARFLTLNNALVTLGMQPLKIEETMTI